MKQYPIREDGTRCDNIDDMSTDELKDMLEYVRLEHDLCDDRHHQLGIRACIEFLEIVLEERSDRGPKCEVIYVDFVVNRRVD